ncbi:ABC transporter substrate-binding protein [Dokdonia sp. Hel_I_53]|uniref:ABC transporter substrate-binding protein n=1 Tax=Dokdonia sp. Hel_I_53 TaxID=1566287 RepID=UPI00119A3FB3|nr:helical backbone metal receptor [Dokdonia sp. Hel_I_53]TVZ51722.1 ABC-type Fe3+-hydroxamate transport system substrate-binding protein [Dokdonia sp. Hel_I_53]
MQIIDQLGRSLSIDKIPLRIVSLVPSQTELLVDLGLSDRIVGITKFCVHPKNLRNDKVIVGGTKQVHYDKIIALEPDIILCNKEENTKQMVLELKEITIVHVSNVRTVSQSLNLIIQYGEIFNVSKIASDLVIEIKRSRNSFKNKVNLLQKNKKVGYLIWKDPMMVAGSDTFIDDMLREIGLENAFKEYDGRYPVIQLENIKNLDYVFLSSEPFPFNYKQLDFFQKNTTGKVLLVDGEYFSWYGSRLLFTYGYFEKLISKL